MGTSIAGAFAYLLDPAKLQAALTAVDAQAKVFDGWPLDRSAPHQFVVGRSGPGDETAAAQGTTVLLTLGAGRINEDYEIPCYIQTFAGGTNQAEARSAALVMWDAFQLWLAADRSLGGALAYGGYAQVARVNIDATPVENTDSGRFCLLTFTIRCTNAYVP